MRNESLEGFFESGSATVLKRKDELQDEWQKTAHAAPRPYNELPKVAKVDKLSLADLKFITDRLLDVLRPGETVCKALRRLKEQQPIFDQVSEDVMLLVENGNIGIYESTKEEIWQKANSAEVTDEIVPNRFYFDAASGCPMMKLQECSMIPLLDTTATMPQDFGTDTTITRRAGN